MYKRLKFYSSICAFFTTHEVMQSTLLSLVVIADFIYNRWICSESPCRLARNEAFLWRQGRCAFPRCLSSVSHVDFETKWWLVHLRGSAFPRARLCLAARDTFDKEIVSQVRKSVDSWNTYVPFVASSSLSFLS